ncbi:hypothetical protein Tco_1153269 [Tanacetum coccineum]
MLRSKSAFIAETLKGVTINEPFSSPVKGNKISSALKVNSSLLLCDIRKPIWYLDNGCSRHMTGVNSYLHKYIEQPRAKVVFGDDSTCTTEGYGSIKPYECPEPFVLETEVSSDQNGQTDQNDQSVQNDEILSDDYSKHSNHTNDEQIIDNLPNTKDIQISKHSSSLRVEDTSV